MFEDPKMEYYREWDRRYDEERSDASETTGTRKDANPTGPKG